MSELSQSERRLISDLTKNLGTDGRYNEISYANIILSSPDTIDTYDPDVVAVPYAISSYWPGAVHIAGDNRHYFQSIIDPREDKNIAEIREYSRAMILGASIGELALMRYQSHLPPIVSKFIERSGPLATFSTMNRCDEKIAPLSVIIFSKVIKSEVMSFGDKLAYMHFPITMHPKPALKQMQKSVRKLVEQEQQSQTSES